jgi:hypothetical protein
MGDEKWPGVRKLIIKQHKAERNPHGRHKAKEPK